MALPIFSLPYSAAPDSAVPDSKVPDNAVPDNAVAGLSLAPDSPPRASFAEKPNKDLRASRARRLAIMTAPLLLAGLFAIGLKRIYSSHHSVTAPPVAISVPNLAPKPVTPAPPGGVPAILLWPSISPSLANALTLPPALTAEPKAPRARGPRALALRQTVGRRARRDKAGSLLAVGSPPESPLPAGSASDKTVPSKTEPTAPSEPTAPADPDADPKLTAAAALPPTDPPRHADSDEPTAGSPPAETAK